MQCKGSASGEYLWSFGARPTPFRFSPLISNSSARLSAAHGDPRLPNLKRRLPDGEKKQLGRQVATAQRGCARVQGFYKSTTKVGCSEFVPGYPQASASESEFTTSEFDCTTARLHRLHIQTARSLELRNCFIR